MNRDGEAKDGAVEKDERAEALKDLEGMVGDETEAGPDAGDAEAGDAGAAEGGEEHADGKGDAEDAADGEKGDDAGKKDAADDAGKKDDAAAGPTAEEAAALKARVAELERTAAERLPLHPSFLAPGEAEAIKAANEAEAALAAKEDALDDMLVAPLKDDDGNDVTPDARREALRKARGEVRELREKVTRTGARADEIYRRAKGEMLEALEIGRKVLAERRTAAEKARKAAGAGKGTEAKSAVATVRLQTGAGGGQVRRPAETRGQNEERFRKAGGGRDAAERELAELVT